MSESDESNHDLYAAVAWCGKMRITSPTLGEAETFAYRAVVAKRGSEGTVYTHLERAEKTAMGELAWVGVEKWHTPWAMAGGKDFAVMVEMLIDAAGKRPDWDTRKLEFAQVHPLADGAPGVPDVLA